MGILFWPSGPSAICRGALLGQQFFPPTCASLARSFSEGRGGGFFFFSADGRYLAKSMTRAEHHALLQLLPQYCRHMQSQPRSLLSRLSGCYSITMYGQTKFFHVRPGPRLSRAPALAEPPP